MRCDNTLRSVPVVIVTAKGVDEESIVASTLSVSKQAGLSVAETVRCIRATLDALLQVNDHSIDQGLPEGLTG
jgi:hypothetical protein